MDERKTSNAGKAAAGDMRWLNVAAAALFATGLVTALLSLLIVSSTRRTRAEDNATMVASERLLSTMKDLETGERGFVITGNEAYLAPYNSAENQVDGDLAGLGTTSQERSELRMRVAEKREFAANVVATRRGGSEAAATGLILTGEDKASMDKVREATGHLETNATQRIAKMDRREAFWAPILQGISGMCVLSSFGIVVLLAVRRRQSERASAALLNTVLDNAPVGLGFVDKSLRIRHVNQALAAMSERTPSSEVGVPLWTVIPDLQSELEAPLRAVIDDGRTITNIDVTAVSQRTPGLSRNLQFGFFPLMDTNKTGRTAGAGLVVLDTTKQKRAEDRVRVSEERFRTLVESSASIVWTTTPSGKLKGNQASWSSFTGQKPSEYNGYGWLHAVHPEDREDAMRTWQAAVRENTLYSAEHRVRRADGEWRYMSARAVPLLDKDDSVREWVGAHTDISAQKEAQEVIRAAKEVAEQANLAKSQFLANMSHELRTPLVRGSSDTASCWKKRWKTRVTRATLRDVRKIQSNARHLLSLINDVLDLSKIEADKMTTYAEDFSVDTLVHDVVNTMKGLAPTRRATLLTSGGRTRPGQHAYGPGEAAAMPLQPDRQRGEVYRARTASRCTRLA